MTVEIVFHFEFLNLNHEGIVWEINITRLFGLFCQDARPDWLRCLSGQVIPSREVV